MCAVGERAGDEFMNDDGEKGISRRKVLQGCTMAVGLGAVGATAAGTAGASSGVQLQAGQTVLFQGDSITDAGRDRENQGAANDLGALGHGYPMFLTYQLLRDYAQHGLSIYNRGISGHKVPDLSARWQADCIDLKPDLLSILVGVNDIWHKLDGKYDGTVADYEEGFARLLQRTRDALPDVTIVVCEPFALRCGAVNDAWFPEMDERRAAAKKVAHEAATLWVPFQSVFDEAVASGSQPEYWAGDGVHPSMAGHSLMAKAWREVVGV